MCTPPAVGERPEILARAHVVAPRGELDLYSVEDVRAAIAARPDECELVVLDLRSLTFFDTSGIRLVVETLRVLAEDGVRFALVRGRPDVQRLFTLTGLEDRLPFFDDLAAAAAA
ncbi:MAG TPA: STAS domain-containing protein [Solirubrobacteraceae bacterium]|nr:STAS domain-containing protein [Solirubrobacteraceae bacterium]